MIDDNRFGRDPVAVQAEVFRMFVGIGKRISSWGALAEASGVPVSSLKSYAQGTTMPYPVLLALLPVLPTEAGNMLIAPSGFKLAPIAPDDANWHELGAEASMLTFEILDAEKDGRIDHVEGAKLKSRARRLVAKAVGMLSDD